MIFPSYITIHFPKGIISIHIFRHIHPIHVFLSFCLFSVPISLTPPPFYNEFPSPKKKKRKEEEEKNQRFNSQLTQHSFF